MEAERAEQSLERGLRKRRQRRWGGSAPTEGSGLYLKGSLEPWESEGSDGPGGDMALAAAGCGSEGLASTLGSDKAGSSRLMRPG